MNTKIREYVEVLFESAPKTHRVFELKEELIQNLGERYNDLLATGKSEEEALEYVKSSIGDVHELISGLEETATVDMGEVNMWRRKTAKVVSLSVVTYIISLAVVILFEIMATSFGIPMLEDLGAILMILIVAGATGALVYHFMSMPKHVKMDNTIVEDFREWQDHKHKNKEIEDAISSIMWVSIVAIYLLISFWSNAWNSTWIIFLVGAALQSVISLIFKLKR